MRYHFQANQSHFHTSGFALRLALKQRHKGIRKWLIKDKHMVKMKMKMFLHGCSDHQDQLFCLFELKKPPWPYG